MPAGSKVTRKQQSARSRRLPAVPPRTPSLPVTGQLAGVRVGPLPRPASTEATGNRPAGRPVTALWARGDRLELARRHSLPFLRAAPSTSAVRCCS